MKINEVESNRGVPGDWVELYNPSRVAGRYLRLVFRDNDDTHAYVIPAGTTIAAGGYYLLEEAAFGFGLGGADSARLFDGTHAARLLHAGRRTPRRPTAAARTAPARSRPTTQSDQGRGKRLFPGPTSPPWPGGAERADRGRPNVFGGNMSGLIYEGSGSATPGVLWAVRNGPGSLFRLVWDGVANSGRPTRPTAGAPGRRCATRTARQSGCRRRDLRRQAARRRTCTSPPSATTT